MAIGSFSKLLQAVTGAFVKDTKNIAEFAEVLKSCWCEYESVGDKLWKNAEREMLGLSLEILQPMYQEVVSALFGSCKHCVKEIRNKCNGTPGQVVYRNGEMFLLGGLLQTFLLSPQGPVDPAEKQNFLLGYAEEEVNISLDN